MTGRRSAIPSPDDVLNRLETERDDERTLEERLAEGRRNGSFAVIGGAMIVVGAIRSLLRGKLRGLLQGVVGLAVLRYGLRQRESIGGEPWTETDADAGAAGKDVSDDAHASLERTDVDGQPRTDPVGTSDSGVESGSDVTFTDDRDEPRTKPGLDADAEDPRRDDENDPVEIDVSEASLADEASEATGPDPEQAQPTRTEDTEPESAPDADASHVESDVPDGSDEGDEEDDGTTFGADEEDDDDRGL